MTFTYGPENDNKKHRNEVRNIIVRIISNNLRSNSVVSSFLSTSINMPYTNNPDDVVVVKIKHLYIPSYIHSGEDAVEKQTEVLLARNQLCVLVSAGFKKVSGLLELNVRIIGNRDIRK